jgi:hypothetical protein
LREIFGPVKANGVWRIRSNQELMDLYREKDTISEIRKGKLLLLKTRGKNARRRTAKKVFKNIPEGKGSFEKPRMKLLDDVENDMKKTDVKGWRKTARNGSANG